MTPKILQDDLPGKALSALLDEFGSSAELARKTGFTPSAVGMWVQRGRVSRRAAVKLELITGRSRKEFRPDLSSDEWEGKDPGRKPGVPAIVSTSDAQLLVDLAEQFGSVKDLCAAAFISVSDYHTYKSRGRIPAIKLPTLLSLQK